MRTTSRLCPTSSPSSPHNQYRDTDGTWYCPIERDAERSRQYAEQLEREQAIEALADYTRGVTAALAAVQQALDGRAIGPARLDEIHMSLTGQPRPAAAE